MGLSAIIALVIGVLYAVYRSIIGAKSAEIEARLAASTHKVKAARKQVVDHDIRLKEAKHEYEKSREEWRNTVAQYNANSLKRPNGEDSDSS